jgi:hypothetical protein
VNSPQELAKANAEIAKRIQEMTLRNLELQRLHLEEEIERLRAQNRRLAERDYKPGFINYITQREYLEAVIYPLMLVLGLFGLIGTILLALTKLSRHGWL